ncbi:MAG: hypothetical protein J6J36_08280 [Clostridia bacterium]|nr:hypothetical protein [Clostridia bacterium]
MVTKEYSEALVEVLEIINCLDENERKKIPDEIIKFYEENKSTTYKPILNLNSDNISNAILKNKTREILAGIYIDYLCDNEDQKNEYIKELHKTEYGYEEEKKTEYEQLPIYAQELAAFENQKKEANNETDSIDDTKALVNVDNQNIFMRIWLKIKSFFKRK